jgi:hypothetical protein
MLAETLRELAGRRDGLVAGVEADSAMPAPMNPPPMMATDSIVFDTFPYLRLSELTR